MVLLQDVLNTLVADAEAEGTKRPSADIARGLLATGQSAPSDAEVEQWLEERRTEKYG